MATAVGPHVASGQTAPNSTPSSSTDSAPSTAPDREVAQRRFAQGQRAFKSGDFRHAAEEFEAAYAAAPHPDVLWNAARAWHRARELSRAANLYARFLREAPADSLDRNSATAALRDVSTKIARIDVVAPDFQDVRVDEQTVDGSTIYVTAGTHVVEGKSGGHLVRQTSTVAAGDVISVALVAPLGKEPPPPPNTSPSTGMTAGPAQGQTAQGQTTADVGQHPVATRSQGWPPAVVYAAGAATLLAGGFTLWSAVDTQHARNDYNGTQQALDDGLSKEHRTNIAIVATAVLGAFTVASAAFFVGWRRPQVKVGVGVGSIALDGRF
jgi:tetratricopeptide (TPR) repeat protein